MSKKESLEERVEKRSKLVSCLALEINQGCDHMTRVTLRAIIKMEDYNVRDLRKDVAKEAMETIPQDAYSEEQLNKELDYWFAEESATPRGMYLYKKYSFFTNRYEAYKVPVEILEHTDKSTKIRILGSMTRRPIGDVLWVSKNKVEVAGLPEPKDIGIDNWWQKL